MFKNWWQLGFHPKFAIDTLSFYSVVIVFFIYLWQINDDDDDDDDGDDTEFGC